MKIKLRNGFVVGVCTDQGCSCRGTWIIEEPGNPLPSSRERAMAAARYAVHGVPAGAEDVAHATSSDGFEPEGETY